MTNATRLPWMTDDQFECWGMLAELFGGFHHLDPRRVAKCAEGIAYRHAGELATFDASGLTSLVFLAHKNCIRAAVRDGSFGYTKICLWKRKGRDGQYYQRHPTLDEAIEKFEKTR